jgi:hypothetical protein
MQQRGRSLYQVLGGELKAATLLEAVAAFDAKVPWAPRPSMVCLATAIKAGFRPRGAGQSGCIKARAKSASKVVIGSVARDNLGKTRLRVGSKTPFDPPAYIFSGVKISNGSNR